MTASDPRDPSTILQTCQQQLLRYAVYEQLPSIFSAASQWPSRALQRYQERDHTYDARQGAIGDPFRGWIDPGLADGIDERRARYEEYLRKKQEAKEQRGEQGKG